MSRIRRLSWSGVLLVAAACACGAPSAHAQGAASDSLVERYVQGMSDSTDAFFGITAQLPDSAGLDSALAYGLANPKQAGRPRGMRLAVGPAVSFNRVLGGVMGASLSAGRSRGAGRVTGTLQWANGPDLWLGGGRYTKRWSRLEDEGPQWSASVAAGRHGDALNRDHFDRQFQALYAFLYGNDRHHYLRRDGVDVSLERETDRLWASLGWRSDLESPLATTATWTLFGAEPVVVPNVAAAFGRANELRANIGGRVPRLPVTLEAQWWGAGGPLGGDLEYSRGRIAGGGAFPVGTLFALTPQFEYGRLTGAALPQDAFWLGGGSGLRAESSQSLSGTGGVAFGADFILQDDVLHALHLRKPPTFPIQVGVFAGAGASWGHDDSGVAQLTEHLWPERREWRPEAGVSLLYRPGMPDPDTFVRVDYAVPLGPLDRDARVSLSVGKVLGALHRR